MVYGTGGYRLGDFARVDAPLSIVMVIVAGFVVPVAWPPRWRAAPRLPAGFP